VKARFTDADAVEVTLDNGDLLTLYRTNLSGGWHTVWINPADGSEPRRAPECFTPTDELLALISEAEKNRPESMDEFMERTANTGVAASLRRFAWASGNPLDKVVEDFNAIVEYDQQIRVAEAE
jgi:hypothetical protein